MTFVDADLTDDGFLGGRLAILQPRHGYRAATDPVLLAAATAACPGDTVLELGCGAGVASLCLAARVPGLRMSGLERQPAYAALARTNAARNGLDLEVVEGDLAQVPQPLRRPFDHVIANPPTSRAATAPPPAIPGARRRCARTRRCRSGSTVPPGGWCPAAG